MLAKRIIPCLDVRNGRVVKGKKFLDIVDVEDPVVLAKRYTSLGADELVFYDITASDETRQTDLNYVWQVAEALNIPFCVGGGIRSLEDISHLLKKGADKVSLNTAAVYDKSLIKKASDKFGSQCIVLSIDVIKTVDGYKVTTHGGRRLTDIDALEWAKEGVALGAGELVINAMDQDGMKEGFALDLLKRVSACVNVPVIASGGAGKIQDFIDAVNVANVDGLLAASVFHYGEIEINTLKRHLKDAGIPVRIEGGS